VIRSHKEPKLQGSSLLEHVLPFALWEQPARTARLVVLTLLAGLAEAVGIAAVLTLLSKELLGGSGNPLDRFVSKAFAWVGLVPNLTTLLFVLVAVISAKALLGLLARVQAGYATAAVARELRTKLIDALVRSNWSFFVYLPTGRVSHALLSETGRVASVYMGVVAMAAALIQAIVYVGLAAAVSFYATIIALLGGLGAARVLNFLVVRTRETGRRQTRIANLMSVRTVESVSSFKPLKAMGLLRLVMPLLEKQSRKLEKLQRRLAWDSAALKSYYEPLIAMLLALGIYGMVTWFSMPIFDVLVLVLLFNRVAARIGALQGSYQSLVRGESALLSLQELLDAATASAEVVGGGRAPRLKRGIQLKDVSFAYSEHVVLQNVNLTIRAKEVTALVGPSGAGKSTLLDLVTGLQRPTSGKILVDGVDFAEIDVAAWRRGIGYVPQEVLLFDDTLLANVTLGDPNLTEADALKALKDAGADFLGTLPEGLATRMGERGGRLSGGQKQRVALARALAHGPELLILDEATSSLDVATEKAISETLNGLKGRLTIVLATHRPTLLEIADQVYRLDGGELVTEPPRPAKALVF
jgi:ATP-binding cassette subfamily C protein